MKIKFFLKDAGREALSKAISEILGQEMTYNGTPAFSYAVGGYVIDRYGALICPPAEQGETDRLIAALKERGYEANIFPDYHTLQMTEREELGLGRERHDPWGEDGMQSDDIPDDGVPNRLTIDMPLGSFTDKAIENLEEIIASKNRLIKKALGTDSLRIDITDDKLQFPWFTLTGEDGEMDAYLRFIAALCKMAKDQKRVTAKEREVENDKFTMRLFLLRLGFIGPEFKTARKILLRNLTGSTAYAKTGDNLKNPVSRVEEP